MNLTKANNARLILNIQDENNNILKVLGDAKGKIVFYYDDNNTKCFEIEKGMLADKITEYLKQHYIEHNKDLDKDLEDL
jgi:hypothetical protein